MKKTIICFSLFLLTGISLFAQVGISANGSSPNASAILDVNSTTRGMLPPRMTTAQRNAIVSPAGGLVIFNTDEKALNVYAGTAWESLKPEPSFVCGLTITVNHLVSGGVSPVNKTAAYGTVNGIPGEPAKCWITSNLGADHQATAVDDATEASAGWYWQFNRKQGFKNDGSTITPAWTISVINENQDWQASNDPCTIELGADWHLPSNIEWNNVNNSGWFNWNGPWNSGLKLHAAGHLDINNGVLMAPGIFGRYWGNTQGDASTGSFLYFSSWECYMTSSYKAYGQTVRCIRNN